MAPADATLKFLSAAARAFREAAAKAAADDQRAMLGIYLRAKGVLEQGDPG